MGSIQFRNEEGNVGINSMILRVANDGIAGAGEMLFGGASDGRIERGENEVAVESGIKALDDEAAGGFRNRRVEVPSNGFGVGLAGRTFGGGNFGEIKPRMIAEHLNEALADNSCGTAGARFPLFRRPLRLHILISVVLRWGIHAVPPC